MKNSAIKIGYPANSRMAEDLAPAAELLELEGKQGVFQSRFVRGAEFLPRRVSDIARFVKSGLFQAGIFGDDTACEEGLEIPGWSDEILEQLARIKKREEADPFNPVLEPYKYYPEDRIARLRFGDPCFMTLFARPDVKDAFSSPAALLQAGSIATSYPRLAEKTLRLSNFLKPVKIKTFDGKIEAIVANRDDPRIVGGFDLVRTGKTLEEFGLRQYGPVLESRPGLWRTSNIFRDEANRVDDAIGALKGRLKPYLYVCDGQNRE